MSNFDSNLAGRAKNPYRFYDIWGDIMLERDYQAQLIKKIKNLFPGCIVLKNDPEYLQGFPDLTILYRDTWAVLEVKRSKDASHRPNQDFYVRMANKMSYASFIYPENEEEVLNELQQAFGFRREACLSEPERISLAAIRFCEDAIAPKDLAS